MKALPTNYKKIIFRSRTEARWAVFFDNLGIKWDYENQGFNLGNKLNYLPDFEITLPNGEQYYIEVKPENFDKFEKIDYIKKLQLFSSEANRSIIILHGNPKCRPYDVLAPNRTNGGQLGFFQDYEPFFRICDSYWMQYINFNSYNSTPEIAWNMDDRQIEKTFGLKYLEAIEKSRIEKFGI